MIGAKIKQYLQDHGIKQSFLAQQTGLTDQVISDICVKDRKIDCYEYFKICQALNLSLEYFFKDLK